MSAIAPERHYKTMLFDSARWAEFKPRDGDVVVCTSYKAGTTWTQMVCALLIHQDPALPAPLANLSPWLDMRTESVEDVLGGLEAQRHRRIIKTHTPLDGLPYFENATYIVCGRDPRDVFMSLQNHLANGNQMQGAALLMKQGVDFQETPPPAPLPDDIDERFKIWMNASTFAWEQDGAPYWSHFQHAATFWAERRRPNIHFLHYEDMMADLDGEMRRMAGILNVSIDEMNWPALVKAATFTEMKANADRTAPDTNHQLWKSNSQFFNKGESGQWQGALSPESAALYEQASRQRYDAVMLDWLERGGRAAGDPKAR